MKEYTNAIKQRQILIETIKQMFRINGNFDDFQLVKSKKMKRDPPS